jgi:hypothetical protein
MLIYALALIAAEPTALTDIHKRDIACVVEIAVIVEQQKRSSAAQGELAQNGKRWELVAFAMNEAAKQRAVNSAPVDAGAGCIQQMHAELTAVDAANMPLPKPEKAK